MTTIPLQLLRATVFAFCGLLGGVAHGQTAEDGDDPSPAAVCVEKHEQAQVARLDGRLQESKTFLTACASDQCPSFVRGDCVRWLDEVRGEIPTVIFEALGDAGSLTEVRVTHDEREIAARLEGRPLELDPGVYTFEFSLESGDTKSMRVFLRQGEKNKLISVDFRTPKPETDVGGGATAGGPSAPPPEETRPVPTAAYVAGGVAAVATASFIGFGIVTKMKEGDATDTCAPNCSSSVVDEIKTFALIADLSLGVAVASAATAAVLYLTRPTVVTTPKEMARSRRIEPVVAPTSGGGWLGINGVF